MRIIPLIVSIFFAMSVFASESVWVHSDGSGWGSNESFACRDAERDAERGLDSECRWEADGNFYTLTAIRYSRCSCTESGSTTRCRTNGDALCQIWD